MTYTTKREMAPQLGHPTQLAIRPTPFPGNTAQRMIPRRFSGWDPYEVWRTRVKAPREPESEILDLAKAG
jgi:rRNA maturation protein Nop10